MWLFSKVRFKYLEAKKEYYSWEFYRVENSFYSFKIVLIATEKRILTPSIFINLKPYSHRARADLHIPVFYKPPSHGNKPITLRIISFYPFYRTVNMKKS